MKKTLISVVFSFLFFFSGTGIFAHSSTFLEGQSPIQVVDGRLYFFDVSTDNRQPILFTSDDKGGVWRASPIASTNFEEGTGSLAINQRSGIFSLFLVNKDLNPSLYISADQGKLWRQQVLSGLDLKFTGNHYVNLLSDPKTNDLQLFIYDFSQDQLNLGTLLYTSADQGVMWTKVVPSVLPDKSFILPSATSAYFMKYTYGFKNYFHEDTQKFSSELYLSNDKGLSFKKVTPTGIPENSILFTLSIDPQTPTTTYLIALLQDDSTVLLKSTDKGTHWQTVVSQATLGGGKILDVQVSPADSDMVFLYSEEKRFISHDGGASFIPLSIPQEEIMGFFSLDANDASALYYTNLAQQKLKKSVDGGATWIDITPRYEAAWVSQAQGTGSLQGTDVKPFLAKAGGKVELQANFRNSGNVVWTNEGFLKIGFFAYKDINFSGPPQYSDPTNTALFGKSWFADASWGPSAEGTVANVRAALLKETEVLPGAIGTFPFTFSIPADATPNKSTDEWATIYDDRYIREDLTLAWGPNWMSNVTNGDPLKKAHVWFPVRIE